MIIIIILWVSMRDTTVTTIVMTTMATVGLPTLTFGTAPATGLQLWKRPPSNSSRLRWAIGSY